MFSVVVHALNPSTWIAEAGRSLLSSRPARAVESYLKKKKKKRLVQRVGKMLFPGEPVRAFLEEREVSLPLSTMVSGFTQPA